MASEGRAGMIYRVSHLAAYARWKEDEDSDVGWLINQILHDEPTPEMAKGTAFHKFLENSLEGTETNQTTIDGYTFAFVGNFELYLPPLREVRREKNYDGLTVSGQVDAIAGKVIWDHKTTSKFDAENYLSSWQHKFYLDIFEANTFVWNVWEMNELKEPNAYGVHSLHELKQFRYPGMEQDCRNLAAEFKEFAQKWLIPLDEKQFARQ
jgi:hypothetical protein